MTYEDLGMFGRFRKIKIIGPRGKASPLFVLVPVSEEFEGDLGFQSANMILAHNFW